MGYNSRLDTFQAIVGSWLLPKAKRLLIEELKMQNIMTKIFQR